MTPDPIGLAGGINPFIYSYNNPINAVDPLGLKTYITLTLSAGGSAAFVSLEGGAIYAIDPDSGEVHSYTYFGYGVGLGAGGAATAQIGVMDMDYPKAIAGPGMEVTAFAAAGKGATAQISGAPAYGAAGSAAGYAAGAGFGVSGMGTYTWYEGSYDLNNLPEDILDKLQKYLPDLFTQENNCP